VAVSELVVIHWKSWRKRPAIDFEGFVDGVKVRIVVFEDTGNLAYYKCREHGRTVCEHIRIAYRYVLRREGLI